MKFIIFKNRLQKALIAVSRITTKNFSLPVLEYMLVEVKNKKICFSTTNLEIAIQVWAQGKIEKDGAVLVPAQLMNQIVSGLDAEKIEIESKDMGLVIKTESYEGFVKGITVDDFPVIPKVSSKKTFSLPAQEVRKGLAQLSNIIVISEARPEISGAYIIIEEDQLCLVGTDSFRLGEKKIKLQSPLTKKDDPIKMIIPLKAVQELIRLMEYQGEELVLSVEQSQALFDMGDIHVVSRLIEGVYPDYKKVVPQEFGLECVIPKPTIVEKIKLASLFSPKTNDVKCDISVKQQQLTLQAGSSAMGETTVVVPVKAQGEDLKAVFNYRFLLDGLANIEGNTAIFRFDKQFKKLLIRAKEAKDFIYVVMPIKE
ncbi:MAG: DNA polymerase III subunit beta [Parcubacteria group bacterium RIFCSPHIGHO2_01_FULL_47_10b]|nr:MAG: DNA polymerase III subunit beta [Parcubacteria group bacterium RIFCSPHIGHO2_01_FULL_47_10b]